MTDVNTVPRSSNSLREKVAEFDAENHRYWTANSTIITSINSYKSCQLENQSVDKVIRKLPGLHFIGGETANEHA